MLRLTVLVAGLVAVMGLVTVSGLPSWVGWLVVAAGVAAWWGGERSACCRGLCGSSS